MSEPNIGDNARSAVTNDAQRAEQGIPAPQPADEEQGVCWVCGAAVDERHCKIVCPRCGFMRDCSDP